MSLPFPDKFVAISPDICINTSKALNPLKNSIRGVSSSQKYTLLKRILQPERVNQLHYNGLSLELVHNYFLGNLSPEHSEGVRRSLIGAEGNIAAIKSLALRGIKEVQSEIPVMETRVDVLAKITKNTFFTVLKPDNNMSFTETYELLPKGYIAFEVKSVHHLNKYKKKLDQQIPQIKSKFKKCYVAVSYDTVVDSSTLRRINELGAKVIRLDVSTGSLLNNINNMRKIYLKNI